MSYAMCLDNSWDVMCEEEMYDVNGGWGFPKWSSSKFLKNFNGLVGGFSHLAGIGVIISTVRSIAPLGYAAVALYFPRLATLIGAIPIPGARVVAATLATSSVALATSMGYFKMFY